VVPDVAVLDGKLDVVTASEPFDLRGKVALVTGGNTGIGLAFARALAGAGASVCVWGRRPEKNAAAVAELSTFGVEAASLVVDVTDEAAVVAGIAATVAQFGRLDACFANAAGLGPQPRTFLESTTDEWRATIALALDSTYVTLREAARVLVEQGEGGSLVATSSLSALYGSTPGSHAYAVAKAGVITLVRGLAVELARHRIRANTILPAWVDSDMMAGINENPPAADALRKRIPMRRFASTDELGPLAVYLAGDGSTWHTGDEFVLDGGFRVA
jgi:NAD(P)-dependent dehydrogenase (short-subunit alcohol dehydrogenase family)